jgi:hypothetical protein
MRPKIVILALVVAFGLVALAAVLKGTFGGRVQEVKLPESTPSETTLSGSTNLIVEPNSSNTAAIVEQLRAAEIAKELVLIRELQTDGVDNPHTTGILLGKVTHREPEVRKAALQTLVLLSDTNAIPGLEQAAALIEDPREKVAVLDAVTYLKLPEGTPDLGRPIAPNTSTRVTEATKPKKIVPNPKFMAAKKKKGQSPGTPKGATEGEPAAPGTPDQTQPVPLQDTPPPQ